MRRMLSFLAAEVSRRQTRTTILLCLCSAVCCVSGQSVPGQGGEDIGADIISISSKEENSFLVNMFKTKWKGLPEVLLGLFYDSDDNSLKWYDQSEVTFLNWGQVQLADNNLNTCVKMNTQSGLWDVTDCDNFTESAALCKYVPKETRTFDKKAMMITLITTFTIISLVLPIVVLLHKRRNWSNGLHRAEVLPYSDDAVLVDTMEREAYA
ncbi:CD302 antigen isoform X2 [Rhinoderma darwinii]|uniref:CD302 antigen isoform X2 n=1 Tax=Rhinoderma darwinii TaxID=43563 RepID=UPI003F665B02